ncbi:Ribosome production factor 2-like protein [Sciurus carolinensis]|uniref:Ribosome production factor 2 homolog n=1 Tax=Sciurus carolinensis TaxID=30640 RepID=A0AA41SUF1_SCICA|nr:Ribosome production factor 2-like protein [Sciurus carolinensis]
MAATPPEGLPQEVTSLQFPVPSARVHAPVWRNRAVSIFDQFGDAVAMDALDRVIKPKTKRAKRFLEKREPKLSENIKNAMLIKGGNANTTVTQVLKDVEFFSKKSDCSLFMFGSHNKKRPNNLVIDFFRGPTVSNIRLAGLEYVLHFTALNGKIYFRSYKLLLKKSGCRTPRIELEEMGPSLDLVVRRTHLASDDLYKLSMKMPKALKPKKKKNISHDTFGTTYGRIHMQKQDLSKLQTRKMKGLKKRPAERITEDQEKKSKKMKRN